MPRVPGFPYATTTFHSVPYFALIDMCDQDKVRWDYDPLSQEIALFKDQREVKLMIGSLSVFVDGETRRLSAPVELKDGVIYAPLEVRGYFVAPVCNLPVKPQAGQGAYLRPVETIIIDAGLLNLLIGVAYVLLDPRIRY